MIPRLNSKEVAAIFSAPFHKFLSDGKDEPQPANGSKRKPWYESMFNVSNDKNRPMHNFYIPRNQQVVGDVSEDTYRVFGLTASILIGAARIAYDETPNFVHRKEVGDEDIIRGLIKIGRMKDEKGTKGFLSREDLQAAHEAKNKI